MAGIATAVGDWLAIGGLAVGAPGGAELGDE